MNHALLPMRRSLLAALLGLRWAARAAAAPEAILGACYDVATVIVERILNVCRELGVSCQRAAS